MKFPVPLAMAETAAWLIAEEFDHPVETRDAVTMSDSGQSEAEVVVAFDRQPDDGTPNRIKEILEVIGLTDIPIETRSSTDDSWRHGWRAFFRGRKISDRIWIGPPWEPKADTPVSIHIEPGLAFGTGTHETTRGCLLMLDKILGDRPPLEVLDVGCGSGVLAIAAAQCGHEVLGVDNDKDALPNARHNVALNDVEDRIRLSHDTAGSVSGSFPVVVANILAPILVSEAPAISARCDGDLILSGLLEKQVPDVLQAYSDWTMKAKSTCGEWQILHLVLS